jgi:hypothetical protein
MSGRDDLIQEVRDEFGRMRAHLFEAVEATGWPAKQQSGWKGVIRTITYDSQGSIEGALRRGDNNHAGDSGDVPELRGAALQRR